MAQAKKSLKSRWLSIRYGPSGRLLLAVAALVACTGASAVRPHVLFAGGGWAAIDFGSRCEARTKGLWAKAGTEPYAGFTFAPVGGAQGRFYVHLARPARGGASVIATIGNDPFLLAGRGEWAWSRNLDQHRAILDAARYGRSMRVESRDASGRRIVDRYTLAGAATAIDAAAAACAGKRR